jgi:hypothetical protein
MAGGIQKGTEAGSEESKKLDNDVKMIAEAIAYVQSKYFFERGHKVYDETRTNKKIIIENAIPEFTVRGVLLGCVPDGGMWFSADRSDTTRLLQFVFEAKYQDVEGNAIERWNKNQYICSKIFPNVQYITFMTGPGAANKEVMHNHGSTMSSLDPNNIFYYAPEGFNQEGIFNIMISNLGLDLKFEDIKPYLYTKSTKTKSKAKTKSKSNIFDDLFETDEQRKARLDEANARYQSELAFAQFSKDPADPLYPVWHRLPKDVKADAHTIVIDMLQEGKANAVIATELVECFLSK